ncbi:MAG: peroxiredoxin-like family protein [Planctomycetota bacterium]
MSQTAARNESPTLAEDIAEYRAGFVKKAPQELQALFQERIDDLGASGVLGGAKNVGDTAPDFELPNAAGELVRLSDLLKDGPVILNWYRGGWCPYCNLTLRAYQSRLDDIAAAGGTFVAVSPELPDNSLSTKQKNELAYPVLTDAGNHTARSYGLVFQLQDDLATIYNDAFDLNAHNGDATNELPLAATYVIATDGTIRYAFLSSDYRERAEPSEAIAALKGL